MIRYVRRGRCHFYTFKKDLVFDVQQWACNPSPGKPGDSPIHSAPCLTCACTTLNAGCTRLPGARHWRLMQSAQPDIFHSSVWLVPLTSNNTTLFFRLYLPIHLSLTTTMNTIYRQRSLASTTMSRSTLLRRFNRCRTSKSVHAVICFHRFV